MAYDHTDRLTSRAQELDAELRHAQPEAVLRAAHEAFGDRLALVSSFGAESAVLLHLVSVIAPETPVLFIDTRMLFQETLDYQRELAERLHLCDIRTIRANPARVSFEDPDGTLH
ncbi:MAG TPA: phosphoadenosine phosphosulfate reductase family protein, partial [Phenylobacterium sp.]|nr:phosphoadenosine phosphosulfate reductase family protein [Phenylobacterium sp.]